MSRRLDEMRSGSSSSGMVVPVFDGIRVKYRDWAVPMRLLLKREGLWDLVGEDLIQEAEEERDVVAPRRQRRADEQQEEEDRQHRRMIRDLFGLPRSMAMDKKMEENPRKIWQQLRSTYERRGEDHIVKLQQQLLEALLGEEESIHQQQQEAPSHRIAAAREARECWYCGAKGHVKANVEETDVVGEEDHQPKPSP